MSEGTIPGSVISMCAAVMISLLLISEVNNYLQPVFKTKVVVDRSMDGELMRINFNVSFPALSCEFMSVDVGDAMGLNRYNLTKTVFKRPIDANFNPTGPTQWERGHGKEVEHADDAAHEEAMALVASHAEAREANPEDDHPEPVLALDATNFEAAKQGATVLLVNFFAPWCPWSRRLEPVWEAAGISVHKKYPAHLANRVVLAKVDCTLHEMLCRQNHIQGYPSIRIFTKGSDVIDHGRHHDHASYHGDRTVEAIAKFADTMLPEETAHQAAQAPVAIKAPAASDQIKSVGGPGCSVTGFVLVKKVPGHLWVTATSKSHSFHAESMNMSHTVHHFYFGQQLSPQRRRYLEKFHAGEQSGDWHDKLAGDTVVSRERNTTHEHYLQTVLTTIKPAGSPVGFNVYEYTQHSHSYTTRSELPRAKFQFSPSPVQTLVTEERQKFYHFITTLMAIIGGVYSVMGIADGFVHNGINMMKKVELGKQT